MTKRDRTELKAQMARAMAEGKMDLYRDLLEQMIAAGAR